MTKDIKWLKKELDDIENNTPALHRHDAIWMLDRVHELYKQLDEPIEDPLATKIEERNHKPIKIPRSEKEIKKVTLHGVVGDIEDFVSDDKVNSPAHYNKGEIEVIDIIKQLVEGYEPFEAYLVGNTIKYLARANFKENKRQDLEKAEWHINKLLEEQNK